MTYGEIKAADNLISSPKCRNNGYLAGKVLSEYFIHMENPQRLSPSGRVKPQANGGRKMQFLYRKLDKQYN